MSIGKLGVWSNIDSLTAAQAQGFAQRLESWGYGAFWMPEGLGREAFSAAAWLLAGTTRLTIATGIANIYARDPVSTAAAQKGLNEQSGGRFLLGLGVSHIPLVQDVRRHVYGKPVETMRTYLTAMKAAPYRAVAVPGSAPRTVIAALGPKMLALAAELADGAHPYNVSPEHTAQARTILGSGKLLCVEQAIILETDARKARERARQFLSFYLRLPNYANNWKRLGFSDTDLAGEGSDRLIDATIAWGDERAIRARLDAHWQAGADHICIQALGTGGMPDERLLELLAPQR